MRIIRSQPVILAGDERVDLVDIARRVHRAVQRERRLAVARRERQFRIRNGHARNRHVAEPERDRAVRLRKRHRHRAERFAEQCRQVKGCGERVVFVHHERERIQHRFEINGREQFRKRSRRIRLTARKQRYITGEIALRDIRRRALEQDVQFPVRVRKLQRDEFAERARSVIRACRQRAIELHAVRKIDLSVCGQVELYALDRHVRIQLKRNRLCFDHLRHGIDKGKQLRERHIPVLIGGSSDRTRLARRREPERRAHDFRGKARAHCIRCRDRADARLFAEQRGKDFVRVHFQRECAVRQRQLFDHAVVIDAQKLCDKRRNIDLRAAERRQRQPRKLHDLFDRRFKFFKRCGKFYVVQREIHRIARERHIERQRQVAVRHVQRARQRKPALQNLHAQVGCDRKPAIRIRRRQPVIFTRNERKNVIHICRKVDGVLRIDLRKRGVLSGFGRHMQRNIHPRRGERRVYVRPIDLPVPLCVLRNGKAEFNGDLQRTERERTRKGRGSLRLRQRAAEKLAEERVRVKSAFRAAEQASEQRRKVVRRKFARKIFVLHVQRIPFVGDRKIAELHLQCVDGKSLPAHGHIEEDIARNRFARDDRIDRKDGPAVQHGRKAFGKIRRSVCLLLFVTRRRRRGIVDEIFFIVGDVCVRFVVRERHRRLARGRRRKERNVGIVLFKDVHGDDRPILLKTEGDPHRLELGIGGEIPHRPHVIEIVRNRGRRVQIDGKRIQTRRCIEGHFRFGDDRLLVDDEVADLRCGETVFCEIFVVRIDRARRAAAPLGIGAVPVVGAVRRGVAHDDAALPEELLHRFRGRKRLVPADAHLRGDHHAVLVVFRDVNILPHVDAHRGRADLRRAVGMVKRALA